MKQTERINAIKAKAKAAALKVRPLVTRYRVYNPKTKRAELRVHVIKSGKEGGSLKRINLIASVLLVEIAVLAVLYVRVLQAFWWFLLVPYVLCIFFAWRVAVGQKNSDSKIAWILFLLIFAPIAFIVYLLAGELTTSPLKSLRLKRIVRDSKFLQHPEICDEISNEVRQDCNYLQSNTDYVPFFDSVTEYFPTGETFFEDVLEQLEKAKKFIFLEFYIFKDGFLSKEIMNILYDKAAKGVDVRIICDGLGSHNSLSFSNVRKIRRNGIKIIAFEPLIPVVNFFMNYRDHRKLIIIDGETGYVGGANIGDEYINAQRRFGYWKDAGMRIQGSAINSLTLTFLRMWEYSSKTRPEYAKFLLPSTSSQSKDIVFPYADGPNEKNKAAKGIYANMIMNARSSVYIMTPYFIVESYILDLLKAKAESGVDVRLIIPGVPDKKASYALTLYNAEKLLRHGVKVFTFTPGFIHSKVVLVDNSRAVVGSVNMDFRSFYHQYESAAYVTGEKNLSGIICDFEETLSYCNEITFETKRKRGILSRCGLALLRLFSPLM